MDAATGILTGPYTGRNSGTICCRITGGQTDEELARFYDCRVQGHFDWIVEQGVRWQAVAGPQRFSLGRTNSFFLGGGRAMLNALYLTAEKTRRREFLYDAEVTTSRSTTACSSPPN